MLDEFERLYSTYKGEKLLEKIKDLERMKIVNPKIDTDQMEFNLDVIKSIHTIEKKLKFLTTVMGLILEDE